MRKIKLLMKLVNFLKIVFLFFLSCNTTQTDNTLANENKNKQKTPVIKKVVEKKYNNAIFENGEWKPSENIMAYREEWEYDTDGKLIVKEFDAERADKVWKVKEIYHYKNGRFIDRDVYADGKKLNKTIQWENDTSYRELFLKDDGSVSTEFHIVLNKAQKPIIEKFYIEKDFSSVTHYTYNNFNFLVASKRTGKNTGTSYITYKVIAEDSFGNPLKTLVTSDHDGTIYRELIIYSYEYY